MSIHSFPSVYTILITIADKLFNAICCHNLTLYPSYFYADVIDQTEINYTERDF